MRPARGGAARPRSSGALAAMALALLACDGPMAARVDPCTARLDRLAEALTRASAARDPEDAPLAVALPRVPTGAPPGTMPLAVVSADAVLLEGRGVGGLSTLDATAEALAHDLRAALALREGEEPFEVGLWAAPEVTLGALVAILRHAPPEVRFVLLARGPAPDEPPVPAWVSRALARPLPPDEDEGVAPAVSAISPAAARRQRLGETWIRATQHCLRAGEVFPIDARGYPETRDVAPLVEAIRLCGCEGRRADAIGALALESLRGEDGPLVRLAHTLRFGPATGEGDELVLREDLSVAALATRLARRRATDAPLWLRTE